MSLVTIYYRRDVSFFVCVFVCVFVCPTLERPYLWAVNVVSDEISPTDTTQKNILWLQRFFSNFSDFRDFVEKHDFWSNFSCQKSKIEPKVESLRIIYKSQGNFLGSIEVESFSFMERLVCCVFELLCVSTYGRLKLKKTQKIPKKFKKFEIFFSSERESDWIFEQSGAQQSRLINFVYLKNWKVFSEKSYEHLKMSSL